MFLARSAIVEEAEIEKQTHIAQLKIEVYQAVDLRCFERLTARLVAMNVEPLPPLLLKTQINRPLDAGPDTEVKEAFSVNRWMATFRSFSNGMGKNSRTPSRIAARSRS